MKRQGIPLTDCGGELPNLPDDILDKIRAVLRRAFPKPPDPKDDILPSRELMRRRLQEHGRNYLLALSGPDTAPMLEACAEFIAEARKLAKAMDKSEDLSYGTSRVFWRDLKRNFDFQEWILEDLGVDPLPDEVSISNRKVFSEVSLNTSIHVVELLKHKLKLKRSAENKALERLSMMLEANYINWTHSKPKETNPKGKPKGICLDFVNEVYNWLVLPGPDGKRWDISSSMRLHRKKELNEAILERRKSE